MHNPAYALRVQQWSASQQWHDEARELLWRCRMQPLSKVLDVGTNMGRMMKLVMKEGGIPIGVEPNESALHLAKQNGCIVYREMKEAVRLHGPFDIVLLSHVLGHCPDPSETLNWCLAASRRDGCVGVIVPNPTYDRLMAPMNAVTGYKSDATLKHSISLRRLKRMLPWWYEITDVFYLGEKSKWLPEKASPESTRSRLGVVIRRRNLKAQ
jgi:2-polyprenyl-3-methyl-5-hydroxy-6-metoxy-1,4-benzoquinol methylase